jgi:hypothetical protein
LRFLRDFMNCLGLPLIAGIASNLALVAVQ